MHCGPDPCCPEIAQIAAGDQLAPLLTRDMPDGTCRCRFLSPAEAPSIDITYDLVGRLCLSEDHSNCCGKRLLRLKQLRERSTHLWVHGAVVVIQIVERLAAELPAVLQAAGLIVQFSSA